MQSKSTFNGQYLSFLLLIFTLAVLNVFTITWFPDVWIDEVLFADPAVNVIQGKGFTSTVWYCQNSTEYWTGNLPLYEYLLIPWIKLFGFSITSVRSIGVFYFFIASLFIWHSFSLKGWVKDHRYKLLFITALWLGNVISTIYRQGRSDSLTILLAAIALVIYFHRGKYRNLLTCIIGFFSVLPGIQLPPLIFIVLVFAIIVSKERKPILGFTLRYCTGVLTGLAVLLLFLYTKGVAYVFLTQTFASGVTITGDIAQLLVYSDDKVASRLAGRLNLFTTFYNFYRQDISAIIISLYYLLVIVYSLVTKTIRRNTLLIFLLYLIIPVAMLLLGRYRWYYSWMAYIILLAGIFNAMQYISSKWIKTGFFIVLVAACFYGLPAKFIKFQNRGAIQQHRIKAFVQKNIAPTDVVFGNHIVYYPCKQLAKEFYAISYAGGRNFPDISPAEQNTITVLIIPPRLLAGTVKKVGGSWQKVNELTEANISLYRRAQ